jgi:DNA topoisomerase-1
VINEIASDGVAAAQLAGLRYTRTTNPAFGVSGGVAASVTSTVTASRSETKASYGAYDDSRSPPAWTDVWISPSPLGHIQATGREARGRKKYRYQERWREVRDEAKYGHLSDFAKALPRSRERVDADLARPGIPRQPVLATAVRILDRTFIRVGNNEYARDNGSFGLTTLRSNHVEVVGSLIVFPIPRKERQGSRGGCS